MKWIIMRILYNAMEYFVPGKYSLVFLGVDIGGLDGFDLYDELKKRDNTIKGYFMIIK